MVAPLRLYIIAALMLAPWWAWAQEQPSNPETDPANYDGD